MGTGTWIGALHRMAAGTGALAALVVSSAALSYGTGGPGDDRPAPASQPSGPQKVLHLEGRSGAPDGLWGEATYKVERAKGVLTKKLEVNVKKAKPGVAHVLTLDGFELGRIVTDPKGEGEFEFVEDGKNLFPEGLPEPKPGTVIKVGDLLTLELKTLEKLADLDLPIAGAGKLSGKVTFKIERLGESVTQEFQVKIAGAPPKTVHAVSLDDVRVGDLAIDLEGKGKLKYSTKEALPFPAGFPTPKGGSKVRIGEIFAGEFRDGRGR